MTSIENVLIKGKSLRLWVEEMKEAHKQANAVMAAHVKFIVNTMEEIGEDYEDEPRRLTKAQISDMYQSYQVIEAITKAFGIPVVFHEFEMEYGEMDTSLSNQFYELAESNNVSKAEAKKLMHIHDFVYSSEVANYRWNSSSATC